MHSGMCLSCCGKPCVATVVQQPYLASTATGTPHSVPVSSGLEGGPNGVSYSTSLASSTPSERGSEKPEPPMIPICTT